MKVTHPIQRALVSVNINCKCGIVLEHDGDIIHSEIEQLTIWIADLFNFEAPGFGLWVFEGNPTLEEYLSMNVIEYDVIWENIVWRDLTSHEWDLFMKREKLWNYQPSNKKQ